MVSGRWERGLTPAWVRMSQVRQYGFSALEGEGGMGRGSGAACVEGPPALGWRVGDPSMLSRLLEHEGRFWSKAPGAEQHSWGLGWARWQAAVQTGLWGGQCTDPQ